jgi:hypothetical protein
MQSADVSAAGDVVDKSGERKFKAVMLTTVGLELSSLIEPSPHWDYVRALAQHLVGTLGVKLWRVDVAFPPDDPDSILVVDQHELPDS